MHSKQQRQIGTNIFVASSSLCFVLQEFGALRTSLLKHNYEDWSKGTHWHIMLLGELGNRTSPCVVQRQSSSPHKLMRFVHDNMCTWQVTLYDPVSYVISHSGVLISITNSYIRFTYLLTILWCIDCSAKSWLSSWLRPHWCGLQDSYIDSCWP